ncbi:hypothetical protein CYLTODRAFT_417435 [Cylindrobasidium torrendii FP15055 ss-10]|uniref:BZIP domain-containing protein n=1 Tax=Cylindrobasidium torrendii FP15055 ss-10 TaxID=1314674 RepID=A0A0D7BRQ8_9AGAR|nr:hypothetical protein CYLTODRAFT_417435 [Cylindrobasidium torrendii FP15055 ss-10]
MTESPERSISRDLDSDNESLNDAGPGKPGRKKNPNSQAARRDQNRIAQREFRLRKQQRIRDLEARVEILSGGKEEVVGELRNVLKDLMAENQTLRRLLKSLGDFIGEGAGGLLPKLGWEMSDFENFVNRMETDTAWEGYQRRKKQEASSSGQKRPADDSMGSQAKKARNDDGQVPGYMMMSMNPPLGPGPGVFPGSRGSHDNTMFPGMNDNPLLAMQNNPSSSPSTSFSSVNNGFPSYVSGLDANSMTFTPPSASSMTPVIPSKQPTLSAVDNVEDEEDPNKHEAYKLIHYHLDNYKRNSAYCLPSSLRPTLVQRTVPHESVIDRILHPELRDRMILLRGRFDLVDCLLDYRQAVTIHGDDVLAHSNWEINEKWLRKYGFLVEQATLNIMNRWRRERGEPDLRLTDISTDQSTPGSS